MKGFDVVVYALSRKFTEDTAEGAGAVAGKPCQIQSIVDEDNKHIVTFLWLDNAGVSHTSTMVVVDGEEGPEGPQGPQGLKGDKGDNGEDGLGITSIVQVPGMAQIIINYSDGSVSDPINIPTIKGDKGDDGDTPTVEVGTVETIDWDEQAEVTETPTATGIELNFKIPKGKPGEGGGGGTGDYDDLTNKPKIEGHTVNSGNQTAESLGLASKEVTDGLNDRVTTLEENPVNPFQFDVMPIASEHPNEVVEFIGASTATYTRGYFYRSTPVVDPGGTLIYEWRQIDTQPSNNDYESMTNRPLINGITLSGDKTSSQLGLQGQIQFDTMPTASATNLGVILQYVGGNSADYLTGYYYQCRYNAESAAYSWVKVDVSSNAALESAVQILQTNQGNMADLEVGGVSTLVAAINKINARAVNTITYTEPYIYINYNDGSVITFSVTNILNETQLGELANVIDDTIQDGNILQWDAAIARYKPYAILTVLTQLLTDSKDYTDTKIAEAIVAGAFVCDEKPEYDAENDTVIYKQGGVTKTTTQTDARFYYYSDGDPFCTSWIEDIEFTFSVADVDFEDYVNKNTDVTNTYAEDLLDKSKVPNVAALDALLAIVKDYLVLKINTDKIEDSLDSQDATKVLSAKQGHILKEAVDTKQDIMQYATIPSPAATLSGKVVQYVGINAGALKNGYFYRCIQNPDTLDYEWQEVKYATDADDHLDENSTNPIQNGVVTVEFGKKLEKVSALPTPTAARIDTIYLLTSAQTGYKLGGIYKCVLVTGSDPAEYEWSLISSANLQAGDGIDITNDTISVENRLTEIDELPTAASTNLDKCYLLTSAQTGYKKGGIYQCQVVPDTDPTEYAWVLISSSPLVGGKGITIEDDTVNADTNVFNGTLDEWEALTAEEQAQYSHIATPDEADKEPVIPRYVSILSRGITTTGSISLDSGKKFSDYQAIKFEVASREGSSSYTYVYRGAIELPIEDIQMGGERTVLVQYNVAGNYYYMAIQITSDTTINVTHVSDSLSSQYTRILRIYGEL